MAYRHLVLMVGIVGLGGCKTLDSLMPFGLGETNEDKIIAEANAQEQVSNNQGPAIGFAVQPDLSKGKCGESPGVSSAWLDGLKTVAQVALESSDLAGSKANPTCQENYVARFSDADSLLSYAKTLPALNGASGMKQEFYKGLVSYAAGTGDIDMYHQLMTQKSGGDVASILQPLRANSASFTTAYARLPWDKQLSVVKAQYQEGASLADMQLPLGAINDMASDRMQGIAEQYNSLVKKYHNGVQSLPTQVADVAANPTVKLPTVVATAPAAVAVAPTPKAVAESIYTPEPAPVAVIKPEPAPAASSLDKVEAVPVAVVSLEEEPKVAVITEPAPEPAVVAVAARPIAQPVQRVRGYRKASSFDLQSGPTNSALVEADSSASASVSSSTSWNLSDEGSDNGNNPWLTLKKLYGSDHTDGRLRRIWISTRGEGYRVKFKNWIQLSCDLSLDSAGNPSAMRNCESAKGWGVKESTIPLSCARKGKEMICSGRYTAVNKGKAERTTARLIHLVQ